MANIRLCILFAFIFCLQTVLRATNSQEAILLLKNAETHLEDFEYEKALEFLRQLEGLEDKLTDNQHTAFLHLLGKTYHQQGKYKKAGTWLHKWHKLSEQNGDKESKAAALNELADNYRYQGEYQKASAYRYQALGYYEAQGDSAQIIETLKGIGVIQLMLKEPHKALQYFDRAKTWYIRKSDSSRLGFVLTAESLAWIQLDSIQRGLNIAMESYEIRKKLNDIRGQGESLNNLAIQYMRLEKWEEARTYMLMSLEKLTEGNDFRQIPVIISNIGFTELKLGRPDLAFDYFQQAIQKARKSGLRDNQANIYRAMYEAYAEQQDFKEAYHYFNLYHDLKDSIFSEEKNRAINELEIRYESGKKEQENQLIRKELKMKRQEKYAWWALFLLGLIIAFLIFSRQRIKMQSSRRQFEAEKNRNKERLTYHTQKIIDKNELIESLEERLEKLQIHDNKAEQERKKRQTELLEMKILTDEDWSEFQKHFDIVYEGFLHQLSDQYPRLTQGERRMFVLLKLKLNAKEMANILGISKNSVKKSRYRLRKKLDLQESQDLQDIINNF